MIKSIQEFENNINNNDIINKINTGDLIELYYTIKENEKEKIHIFKGICISINNKTIKSNITIRKISFSVGIERTFPINNKIIQKIKIIRKEKIKKSKLYYLRNYKQKK